MTGRVPTDATVTGAELNLNLSRTTAGAVEVTVHRLLADWGEGASDASSNEGGGAPAAEGDATWLHRFFDDATWETPGGDFEATPSASTMVTALGSYAWGDADGMVADVQAWLDDPSANFGWLIKGEEGSNRTAKRFDSNDNAEEDLRPVLTIRFTVPGG